MLCQLRQPVPCVSSSVLTLAGVGVASLGWSPGQVIVEVITLLTVQTLGVMVTHTPAVDLRKKCVGGGGQELRVTECDEETKTLMIDFNNESKLHSPFLLYHP